MPDDIIEEKIALDKGAFEIMTEADSVSSDHIYADGGDGLEKEVVVLDPIAGASSTAQPSSGIPSAMRQQAIHHEAVSGQSEHSEETPGADRTIPMREDIKP